MTTFALLAPGDSLTVEQCEAVRGRVDKVIAVSDAYRLAPWADVIVANDAAWWRLRPDARLIPLRYSANPNVDGVEQVKKFGTVIGRGSNSGVLAMWVARMLGAKRMLLIGFDMKGTHFFGPHKDDLHNTTPEQFNDFKTYFVKMKEILDGDDIEVINCTPKSALKCFRMAPLDVALGMREAA